MLHSVLLIGMPGGWEIFLIIFFVLILFGAKKIPELARGFGQGIREFKEATKEIKHNMDEGMQQQPPVNRPNPAPRPMDTPTNTTDNTPQA